MSDLSSTTKTGLLLAFLGVVILSPDSLLVRLIDVPYYTLLFWRGFFMCLALSIFILFDHKGHINEIKHHVNLSTLVVSVLFAASTFLFVAALKHTSVAHTLLIVGSSPIFTNILSFILLKEPIKTRNVMAILIILFALFFVVKQNNQHVSLLGDFYALLSSITMGYVFVHIRKFKHTHLLLSLSFSGLWMAVIAFILSTSIIVRADEAALLLLLGAMVGGAFSLITLSSRYIAAPVTSMFMPLETVLGVGLVWLVVGEQPHISSIIGGLCIVVTLMVIAYMEINQNKN